MVNDPELELATTTPLVRTKNRVQATKTSSNKPNHADDTNVHDLLSGLPSLSVLKLAENEWATPSRPEAVNSVMRVLMAVAANTETTDSPAKTERDSSDTNDATLTSDVHSGEPGTRGHHVLPMTRVTKSDIVDSDTVSIPKILMRILSPVNENVKKVTTKKSCPVIKKNVKLKPNLPLNSYQSENRPILFYSDNNDANNIAEMFNHVF